MKSQIHVSPFVKACKLWDFCGEGFSFTDSCSAWSLWKPSGKYVGIYIYIPNSTAGSGDATIPASYRRQKKEERREEGGKSPHTGLFLLSVHSAAHTGYIHPVCVCQECKETKLHLSELAAPTLRLKTKTD